MPAMHFDLRWPDGTISRCYSPSLVIKDYFDVGTGYSLPDFLRRARESLSIASGRVRAKYGFACSRALDQLAEIEERAEPYASDPGACVEVVRFDEAHP